MRKGKTRTTHRKRLTLVALIGAANLAADTLIVELGTTFGATPGLSLHSHRRAGSDSHELFLCDNR